MNAQLLPTLILVMALGLVLILLFAMCTLIWHKLEQIESVLYEKNIKFDPNANKLANLAVDHWRLKRQVENINGQLTPEDSKRLENSLRRIEKYLQENDIKVEDYTGRMANDGINADILLVEHDPSLKKPIIKETIEPAVLFKGVICKKAKIIVLDNSKNKEK